MFYVNLMATIKQKTCGAYTKIRRRDSTHTAKENHRFTKHNGKGGRKGQGNCKAARKKDQKALVSPSLSVITLNVNRSNSPIKGKE